MDEEGHVQLPLEGVVAFLTKTSVYAKSIDLLKKKLKYV